MAINLKTDPISKSFYQYLWPALTGMVIKSLFIMGDEVSMLVAREATLRANAEVF